MVSGGVHGQEVLIAIGPPPMILSPRHFRRVGVEVTLPDMMMDADFRAAKS